MRHLPHPLSRFFEQAQFERLLDNDPLQSAGLAAQIFHFIHARRPGRITR